MEASKAVWDATAAKFCCECAAKQVGLGNRPTKFLSPTGYKQLVADFNAKTGRNYERKQLKNRWDDLKAIFSAWVFYKIKASGLGWDDATQTITADEAQWAELIKVCCFCNAMITFLMPYSGMLSPILIFKCMCRFISQLKLFAKGHQKTWSCCIKCLRRLMLMVPHL